MENSSSKTENLKPILLKIGLPLALSAAGGLCAVFMARTPFKSSFSAPKSKFREKENFQRLNSSVSLPLEEEGREERGGEVQDQKPSIEESILGLRARVHDLEKQELEIERQFTCYQDLKERESLLVEIRNTLLLDMAHISFLKNEILSMEAENERFESLVLEYLRVSEQLECEKSENKFLDREAKRLKKKLKEKSRVIREKNLKIEESKAEVWRSHNEMEAKKNVIEKLESEVKELQMKLNQLQKKEIKDSSNSKNEAELKSVTMEDCNRLADENSKHEEEEEQKKREERRRKQEISGKSLDKNKALLSESKLEKSSFTRRKFLQKISCVGTASNEKMKGKIRPQKEA